MALSDGVASGDLRAALTAQRDHLVACLEECSPERAAPLHARLTDVLIRLDAITAPKESRLDELAAARKKRRSTA